jgi:drug/metabolite transporter (DMT)-like permease
VASGGGSRTLNRPYAFAMASVSALFLALVGLLGQLATRELSVFPALFMRYLAATLVVLIVLRGTALQTLRKISRLDYLRVGSVLISQFCLFYYLAHGSLLIGMLLYNTGPLVAAAFFDWILYGQVPIAETLLGGMFILVSALTIVLGTLKRHGISHHPIS